MGSVFLLEYACHSCRTFMFGHIGHCEVDDLLVSRLSA